MASNLKGTINSLVPENIKDIKLVKESLDIFLETLLEYSDIAIDIKNIFDKNKPILYTEFIKIYLSSIYKTFNESNHSDEVYIKLKKIFDNQGLDIDETGMTIDVMDFLKEEYIYTNKSYKSAKGTEKSIEYIYNMVIDSGVQGNIMGERDFELEENGLFQFKITGILIPEIYEHYVKPLSHPLGWAYIYRQLFKENFTDYFNLEYMYNFQEFEVRTKFGDIYKIDNYMTNKDSNGDPIVGDNTVKLINAEMYGKNKITTIYFMSGEKLVSNTSPASTVLYNSDNTIIKDYDLLGNTGLYLEYVYSEDTTTTDSFSIALAQEFMCQPSDLNVAGSGILYCGKWVAGEKHNYRDVNVIYRAHAGARNSDILAIPITGDFVVGPKFGMFSSDEFSINYVINGVEITDEIVYIT